MAVRRPCASVARPSPPPKYCPSTYAPRPLDVHGRVIHPGRDVEEPGPRTERRVVPVGRTLVAGIDQRARRSRLLSGHAIRTALLVEALGPGHADERLARQELPGRAIEHVEEAVAVRPQHRFARPALPPDIGQDGNLRGVLIELVVRRELVMPLQLAGVRVERDHRGGVEVVARARDRHSNRDRRCRCPNTSGSTRDRTSRSPRSNRRRSSTNRRPMSRAPARRARQSC